MLFLIVSQKAEFGHFGAQLAEQVDYAVAVNAACKIQIEKILMQFPELASNYLITLTTDEDNDNMTVEVELEELFTDDFQRLLQLTSNVKRALKDEILLTPHVKLVPKGTLPVSDGKAVRVVDKRTVYQ